MKKVLFMISVAAFTLMGCSNESKEYVGNDSPKEIAFMPLAQKATRAAVDGTTFPTTIDMQVAAYDVTHTGNFFTHTTFGHSGAGTIWTGGKYWPLSPAYINFLAYANFQGTAGSETDGATWASDEASQVTLVMTDNKTAQKDLMYAIGNGEVTQSGNSLSFPTNVPMVFQHAQAWISFTATADATSGGKVTLNSITLNGASYAGTYTVTHTGYNATSGQSVAGAWSALGNKGTDSGTNPTNIAASVETPYTQTVPNWNGWDHDSNAGTANVKTIPNGTVLAIGDGLMIVPDDAATNDFISFTVNYTLDGNTYDYTYTPASTNVEQKKHYIYDITFKLHEIQISATVTDWADQTAVDVSII